METSSQWPTHYWEWRGISQVSREPRSFSKSAKAIKGLKVEMWRCSNWNSTTFKLGTFSTDSKFNECFKRFVVECKFVEKSLFYDWFHMHREPESADKPVFFLKFNLQLMNVQYNFCSVMCYTVLILTLILLTLGSNILLQSFDLNQCIMFLYWHSHMTNFQSQNSHSTNANCDATQCQCFTSIICTFLISSY